MLRSGCGAQRRWSTGYLGHKVSSSGISPLAQRVAAITHFPRLDTARQLQTANLDMVDFYLRSAAFILKPLTDVLKGDAPGRLTWAAVLTEAFNNRQVAMLNVAELVHPQPGAQLSMEVDASGSHVGAVLHQDSGGGCCPLGFFSVKFDQAQ